MNQKERLEMIRRKRLREQRRRKFLIRRVFVFAVAIIIAALVIFAIKGCLVEGVDYFARIGLNVNDAMTKSTSTGTVPVIEELNNGKQYNKIFMIFGENELGWANSDTFVEQYGALIDKAKSYQSTAKIYLLAITPVTKEVSDNNVDNTNNEQIVKYNELIKKLAESKGVVYADVYSAVVGEDGNLPDGVASDGIHFGEDYYKKCLVYIQNNIQ